MSPPDCCLQLHNKKLLVLKTKTVKEQERSNASVGTSNMPLVVCFTSDFDNRRAGVWLIKLTYWLYNGFALQFATWDAYCQSY